MGQWVHLPGDLNQHKKALTQFSIWVSGYTFGGPESAQPSSNAVQHMGQQVHLPGDLNQHNKSLTQFSIWVSWYTFGGKLESAQ